MKLGTAIAVSSIAASAAALGLFAPQTDITLWGGYGVLLILSLFVLGLALAEA